MTPTSPDTAAIAIEPPIPFADLTAKADADADVKQQRTTGFPMYRYLFDGIDIGDLSFAVDRTHPNGPCATAILAWKTHPVDGYYRRAALARVVHDFVRTSDDTPRTFTGHLACERNGEPSRLYIRDGELVEVAPELVWHDPPECPAGTRSHPAAASAKELP